MLGQWIKTTLSHSCYEFHFTKYSTNKPQNIFCIVVGGYRTGRKFRGVFNFAFFVGGCRTRKLKPAKGFVYACEIVTQPNSTKFTTCEIFKIRQNIKMHENLHPRNFLPVRYEGDPPPVLDGENPCEHCHLSPCVIATPPSWLRGSAAANLGNLCKGFKCTGSFGHFWAP